LTLPDEGSLYRVNNAFSDSFLVQEMNLAFCGMNIDVYGTGIDLQAVCG
jgi:hypothetical protein